MSKKTPRLHAEIPSEEEVHESGAAAWVDKALEVHERKQERLASLLDDDREALREQQESLKQMWSVSGKTAPPPKAAPPAPDVFAKERARGEAARANLASVFEDDLRAKADEEAQLRNMFGGGPSSPKKPRR